MSEVNLQHIDFKYPKGELIFNDLTLTISKGDFVFLLGANGSGKSTLLKLVLSSVEPTSGDIKFDEIASSKPISSRVGYIPQSYSLDPEMHVSDTLRFIASLHNVSGSKYKERLDFLVDSLGMESILNKKVKQLSGGQKQLTNIALGLIHDPEIILLDEPFVGLDYKIKSNIISTLKSINKTRICVTHDMDIAEYHADRIILLDKGNVIENEQPQKLIEENPFVYYEITFKNNIEDVSFKFSDEISKSKHQNTLILSFPENDHNIKEVENFEKENSNTIASTRINKNSLKSTIIGLHKLELVERKEKKTKGKGGGGGNGQGKIRQNN